MPNSLSFQKVTFDIVDRDGQLWLQSRQISKALGYSSEESIRKIYERNKDEFTDSMTCKVKLTLQGQQHEVRIFSLRGCHLLAMFSRTKVAKEFRRWVLDVLDKEVAKKAALPPPKKKTRQKALPPPPGPSYREKCAEVTAQMFALRGQFFRVSDNMVDVFRRPFWAHAEIITEENKAFAKAMNYAIQSFYMSINKDLEAMDLLFQAYVEGEKLLRK